MIACYILYSKGLDKFYTGITQQSVGGRLLNHNLSSYGRHFTSQADDCAVFLVIECKSVSQSMKIEKHIKKMKSKKYIQNLKTYPEMVEKLKLKFPE